MRGGDRELRDKFSKEFRFRVLGDLRGKLVLDIGCGDGGNSTLFAKLGAKVVGVDISQGLVDLAQERARLNGVSASTRFICSPIETADLEPGSFDIIWGDAVLHHIIDVLDEVLSSATAYAKPGALMMFAEPVNLWQPLRDFRNHLPIPHDGTPGERPLEQRELDIMAKYFQPMSIKHFTLLGRLDRFVLSNMNYEKSATWRRRIADAIAAVDATALAHPFFQPLSSTAVLYGPPAKHAS